MPRQPLYPHVPKGRLSPFRGYPPIGGKPPAIWPPFQKFLNGVRASIKDEVDGNTLYRGMATTATALGMTEWASTLEQMAKDEYRHYGYLEEILKEADAITSLATTEGNPIRKFCCRQCGECAPTELLEEGRFPDRIAWLRSHYKAKHPSMWGKMQPAVIPTNGKKSLQVGDRVKSRAWKGIEGYPWLTVKGVYTSTWGGSMLEVEVTDGITTNRVFEDTIIAHEPGMCSPER